MKIHLKGGVWKNTEDEILKAAVMKYGKTQWGRISSLLVRKTPKQCKARWYEWLDPSIKKTEWSKEEDEKLLHLAKLMPTQWRTIAPIVGRAPAQCLERYQRLLDEAEARAAGEDDGLGLRGEFGAEGQAAAPSHDARKLRPGEIDPNPETKPARPDPVDMDEDEKDMLSEARARLANTQGKKAKRKARERQLEEARRLATLQKRRELKAAGVEVKQKKMKHMDYNKEIPFEKKPAPGFYDTTDELAQASSGPASLKGKFLDTLEAKSRLEREEDVRKEAKRKRDNRNKNTNGISFVRASDQETIEAFAAKEEQEQVSKRKKLVLPTPQVDDTELETIAKFGQQGTLARELVEAGGGGSSGALLSSYSETPSTIAARTARTPAQSNRIMAEALTQRAMAAQATPLLGGESVGPSSAASGTGFKGSLPHASDMATPNPLAASMRQGPQAAGGARTPHTVRDELGLNTPANEVGSTPRERKAAGRGLRQQLAHKLASLPKPKNEFEIVVPEASAEEDARAGGSGGRADAVEDQADIERRQEQKRAEDAQAELLRRTKCVQRNLPRPDTLPVEALPIVSDHSVPSTVVDLISSEMRLLILNDARKHPVPGVPPLRGPHLPGTAVDLDDIPDGLLRDARALVDEEMKSSSEETRDLFDTLSKASASDIWHAADNNETWLPQTKDYVSTQSLSPDDWITKHRLDLSHRRELMAAEAARATKIERKLGVTLGGYQARSKLLSEKIAAAFKEFEQTKLDAEAFASLHASEQAAIPARVESAQEELRLVEARESRLQSEYQALLDCRNSLAAELSKPA
ncbi:Pre-mRNA-splicing factor cef1 [Dipsacomyces acuminosporus]|nr:Pre-mRNA-splicing factor cef1 [Dipsacomyces acuminosporus]